MEVLLPESFSEEQDYRGVACLSFYSNYRRNTLFLLKAFLWVIQNTISNIFLKLMTFTRSMNFTEFLDQFI